MEKKYSIVEFVQKLSNHLKAKKLCGAGVIEYKDGSEVGGVFGVAHNPKDLGALVAGLHCRLLKGFYDQNDTFTMTNYLDGYLSVMTPQEEKERRREARKLCREIFDVFKKKKE